MTLKTKLKMKTTNQETEHTETQNNTT